MAKGQGDGWWWVLLVIVFIVMVSYGAIEIFARHGGNAWDILTMLS